MESKGGISVGQMKCYDCIGILMAYYLSNIFQIGLSKGFLKITAALLFLFLKIGKNIY